MGLVAGSQRMEIGLAFQPQLPPRFSCINTFDKTEGIDQGRARCRMSAAVKSPACGRETHAVMFRSRHLGPLAIGIDCDAMMARDKQLFTVYAIGKPVHVLELNRR